MSQEFLPKSLVKSPKKALFFLFAISDVERAAEAIKTVGHYQSDFKNEEGVKLVQIDVQQTRCYDTVISIKMWGEHDEIGATGFRQETYSDYEYIFLMKKMGSAEAHIHDYIPF